MGYPTNFTNGLTAFGVPTIGANGLPFSTGNYWFVNFANGVDGNQGSANQPLKTTARAIVLAKTGDVVVWQAGHAETITAAGGITMSTAGVTFWSAAQEASEAATFTFTTATTADILISGAGTVVGGASPPVFVCNIASQTKIFSITAANVSLTALVQDTSSTIGAISDVVTTAAASNLTLNITHQGFTASSIGTVMISLVGVVNANVTVDAYGAWSTAVVNFATTACVNVQVNGYFYNYNTALTLDVVDTITGSTWFASGYDGIGGYYFDGGSGKALAPSDPSSLLAVPTANSTANAYERDVIGNKTDAEVYTPGTTKSLVAYIKGLLDTAPKTAQSSVTGVLTTGTTIFTVAGGPIQLLWIMSMCTVGADSTAATLLYTTIPTGLSAVPISTACGSIANAPVNATITYAGTGSAAACVYNSGGTSLSVSTVAGSAVIMPPGVINITIGSGPTVTGHWSHYIYYRPMGSGVTVI